MDDETIRKGDLVCVIRGMQCCGADLSGLIGKHFIVTGFLRDGGNSPCQNCGKYAPGMDGVRGLKGGAVDISRLKKINPPPVTIDATEPQEVEA